MNDKTVCVILNYNVASLTCRLAQTLCGYSAVSDIVVVDNCSTDDSIKVLNAIRNEKIHIVSSDKNGGYGYGNNIGVREAYEKYGAKYVLILNPDVEVEESVIEELKKRMSGYPDCAVASARQISPSQPRTQSCWGLGSIFEHTVRMLPVTGKIYKRIKKKSLYEGDYSEHETECVAGSLLIADAEKFIEAGGYDEDFFLYMEENVLGSRLKKLGYKTLFCGDITYLHNHGVSISKTFRRESKIFDLLRESKQKYLRGYLGASEFQVLVFRVLSAIGKTEMIIWHQIKTRLAGNKKK